MKNLRGIWGFYHCFVSVPGTFGEYCRFKVLLGKDFVQFLNVFLECHSIYQLDISYFNKTELAVTAFIQDI